MNRSGGGALVLALLVAVWAGSGGMRSGEPTPTLGGNPAAKQTAVAAQPKAKKQSSDKQRGASHLYPDGFDDEGDLLATTIAEATSTTLSQDDQIELNDLVNVLPPVDRKVGFMIALAPNPVRTHLSLTFDRTIDALEQALQNSDFDFDRALLPWDNHEHPESDNFLLRVSEDDYRRHAEMVPGVLIFRRHQNAESIMASHAEKSVGKSGVSIPAPVQVLVVFIVADMPTSGVDRVQFNVALALGEKLIRNDEPKNLLIMGPSFSGSLASLKDLLIARAENFQKITIASGQVEGKGSIEAFEDELAQQMPDRVNFASFEENDQSLLNHLYEYACSQWRLKPEEIALVSETETAFGRQPSKPVDIHFSPDCARPSPAEMTPLTLHFPRGIYHIRTAYEQQFGGGTTSDDAGRQTRINLRPNLEESRATADTIPDYSLQSPVSQEAVLMGVVDELHQRQSQLVVLMASDSLDILFLVRYLRKNYAYGRLVILGPDLLLRHESEEPDMRGILAINPYSMRPSEDEDVLTVSDPSQQGQDEAITFADDGEKATYNATMALAACLQNPKDPWCARPILDPPEKAKLPATLHLEDYGRSVLEGDRQIAEGTKCCRPDLHIDTLGRDGYWPVAELEPGDQSRLPLQDGTVAQRQPFEFAAPVAWKALVAAALVCFALILSCLERASLLGSIEPELLLAPAGLNAAGSHGVRRTYLITFLCACWTGIVALALWPVGAKEFRVSPLILVIGAAGVMAYAWFVCILVRRYRRPMWPAHIVFLGTLLAACWISQFEGFRVFFIKYVNIGSGISPLLPLVLVVLSLAWWAWYNIAGSVLTDLRRPLLPRSETVGPQEKPILPPMLAPIGAEEQERLEYVMGPASVDRRIWIPIGGVMFVALLLIFPSRPLRGIEHYGYDYLMISLLVISFVLLLESITRGIIVWTDAKRLLHSIESQPFSMMISRKDGFTWTSIWKIGTGLIDSAHRLILPEMEALKVVQEKAPACLRAHPLFPAKEIEQVWDLYLDLLAERRKKRKSAPTSTAKTEDDLLDGFQKMQAQLADAAALLLGYLFNRYQERPNHKCELDAEEIKKLRAKPLESLEEWSEYYVSLVYINYIITILLRIRTLAMAAVGIFVLDVLAISSYPFEPRAILRTFMFTIFVGLTICFGYVYAQMHRDRTLSRITDTPPEELGADFWFRMLGVTGLPLLSLVATEFPSIGNFLFSWIEPAMKALR